MNLKPRQMPSEMQKRPELSIVIVNWNAADYVIAAIASVEVRTSGVEFEIIVVDNGSDGDDAARIQNACPRATVVRSGRNLGFAAANNLGVRYSSGKYILFLNPDTEVRGTAIQSILRTFVSSNGIGVLGCELLNTDGSVQTSCIQPFPTITNQVFDVDVLQSRSSRRTLLRNEQLTAAGLSAIDVEAVSGACLMIERDTFERVGGFDEGYFMYAEDVDLCYKVHALGKRVAFTKAAVVVHHGGGPSKERKSNEWIAVMQRRAILRFCSLRRGPIYGEMYRLAMGICALCRLVVMMIAVPCSSEATRKRLVRFSLTKWLGILKWSLRLDQNIAPTGENG